MTKDFIDLAADLEQFDPLHEARLLVLLGIAAKKEPVDGIMKLAKMDFLLRYPKVLERALITISSKKPTARKVAARIPEEVKDTVEGRMIRFRYGPWDKRYRRWLAIMVAKGLLNVSKQGRTVQVKLTPRGLEISSQLTNRAEFKELAERADAVRFAVGEMSATRLMNLVYQITPEILGMKWGEAIKL